MNMRGMALVLTTLLASGTISAQQSNETTRQEVVSLRTEDGAGLYAAYHTPAGRQPTVGFVFMHPRGGNVTHFALKPLAERGFAALGMGSRSMNRTGVHEELVLDVAAGVKFLRSRGVKTVILAGHSGGGSLMAFYQSQAEAASGARVKSTPAGDPPDLNKFDMPKADGLVTLNAAEGEGLHFTHHLDPSLTDESDPFSYDPSLDMYSPANGFHEPPAATKYSPEFVEKVRKAQDARARRLVEIAMGKVRAQNDYRDLMKSPAYKQLSEEQQLMVKRRAEFDAPMIVYRTRAELHYFDLSLDPSDREFGHMTGPVVDGYRRSDLRNWQYEDTLSTGITAREFLSTLSIISHAKMWENLAKISVPVLVTNASADSGILPHEAQKTFESVASKDKERVFIIGGEHGYEPNGPKKGKGDQREQLLDAITKWANKRWPQSAGSSAARPPE
jgi:pimeloyl-ACP methyl ester carboxylesterase